MKRLIPEPSAERPRRGSVGGHRSAVWVPSGDDVFVISEGADEAIPRDTWLQTRPSKRHKTAVAELVHAWRKRTKVLIRANQVDALADRLFAVKDEPDIYDLARREILALRASHGRPPLLPVDILAVDNWIAGVIDRLGRRRDWEQLVRRVIRARFIG